MLRATTAWAHHGGPFTDVPMSPLVSTLVFAGLALLVGAVVVVIMAVIMRRPESPPGPPDE